MQGEIGNMIFTVAYRDGNGERIETVFEAESRNALFRMLAGEGISPISVKEGKSKIATRPGLQRGGDGKWDQGPATTSVRQQAGGVGRQQAYDNKGEVWAGDDNKRTTTSGEGWQTDCGKGGTHRVGCMQETGRRLARLAAVVFAIAAIVGGAWWFVSREEVKLEPEEPQEANGPEKIPDESKTDPGKAEEAEKPGGRGANAETAQEKEPSTETYIDEAGVERYKGGLRVYKGGGDRSELFPGRRRIFKHASEVQISHLFTIRPGATVFGTKRFDRRFTEDFLKSLDEPIVDEEEDTPAERELKERVREAKKELKAAYDRGEDIAQIMTDSRKELVRLGAFRRELEKMVADEAGKPGATEDDVKAFIAAANKALEEKGAAPIGNSILTRHAVRSYIENKKGKGK